MRTSLNTYKVAKRYEVSVSTVFVWRVRDWIIPPKRIGGRVFWLEDDLDTWDAEGNPRPIDSKKEKEVEA